VGGVRRERDSEVDGGSCTREDDAGSCAREDEATALTCCGGRRARGAFSFSFRLCSSTSMSKSSPALSETRFLRGAAEAALSFVVRVPSLRPSISISVSSPAFSLRTRGGGPLSFCGDPSSSLPLPPLPPHCPIPAKNERNAPSTSLGSPRDGSGFGFGLGSARWSWTLVSEVTDARDPEAVVGGREMVVGVGGTDAKKSESSVVRLLSAGAGLGFGAGRAEGGLGLGGSDCGETDTSRTVRSG
jgi:hypothetical protein